MFESRTAHARRNLTFRIKESGFLGVHPLAGESVSLLAQDTSTSRLNLKLNGQQSGSSGSDLCS